LTLLNDFLLTILSLLLVVQLLYKRLISEDSLMNGFTVEDDTSLLFENGKPHYVITTNKFAYQIFNQGSQVMQQQCTPRIALENKHL